MFRLFFDDSLVTDNDSENDFGEFVIFAVIAGAFTGNFFWDRISKKFK